MRVSERVACVPLIDTGICSFSLSLSLSHSLARSLSVLRVSLPVFVLRPSPSQPPPAPSHALAYPRCPTQPNPTGTHQLWLQCVVVVGDHSACYSLHLLTYLRTYFSASHASSTSVFQVQRRVERLASKPFNVVGGRGFSVTACARSSWTRRDSEKTKQFGIDPTCRPSLPVRTGAWVGALAGADYLFSEKVPRACCSNVGAPGVYFDWFRNGQSVVCEIILGSAAGSKNTKSRRAQPLGRQWRTP